jgi:hypothetical protein
MKIIESFSEFINESNQYGEEFENTPTPDKIAKVLMKKHETLEMNAENFDKIQAAVREFDDMYGTGFYNIANASKYTEQAQSSVQGNKFLFDKKGKLKFIIAYVGPGRNLVKFPYIADKNKDQEVEDWAYENYPRLFKDLDFLVYQFSSYGYRDYSDEGTFELVSAPTKKLAMENTKANPSKDDSFWQNHACVQISKQDVKEKQKELKQKADHYTKLVKQFGK